MSNDYLYDIAVSVMNKAYAPYSHFKVGAALETTAGQIFTGCNIENSSYSLTSCAERVAIFKAISESQYKFKHLAIVAETDDFISPCGACRQVMSEFFSKDMPIYLYNRHGEYKQVSIAQLLPDSFRL